MPKRVRSPAYSTASSSPDRKGDTPHFPTLASYDLVPLPVKGDGACLYRAISHGLYGYEEGHGHLRKWAVEHMRLNHAKFAPYYADEHLERRARNDHLKQKVIDTDKAFEAYLLKMESPTQWAGHLELQALANSMGVEIVVHTSDGTVTSVDSGERKPAQIHICFDVRGEHYWATKDSRGTKSSSPDCSAAEVHRPEKEARVEKRRYNRRTYTLAKKDIVQLSLEVIDWSAKMGITFDEEED